MSKSRDEFTETTKRTMAERVAWRCSFPGCGKNTVGPDSADPKKRINNGTAAHICAAAPNGPRYDQCMSTEERRSITNGIWMCKDHGTLIDSDYTIYSIDTLRQWKQEAEYKAAETLRDPSVEKVAQSATFLQLGDDLMINVRWSIVDSNKWVFELVGMVIGEISHLNQYILEFNNLNEHEKFAVIESQGDARKLLSISLKQDNGTFLDLSVADKLPVEDPNHIGSDLRLGPDGDLCFENGITRISGKEAAVQRLSTSMGLIKGEIEESPWLGSKVSSYYNQYHNQFELMARLIKMEFIRLSLIPMKKHISSGESRSLPFVKRFVQVSIQSMQLVHSRLSIDVELEWGDDTEWKGTIPVFVLKET